MSTETGTLHNTSQPPTYQGSTHVSDSGSDLSRQFIHLIVAAPCPDDADHLHGHISSCHPNSQTQKGMIIPLGLIIALCALI
jgi:hypothetical protein